MSRIFDAPKQLILLTGCRSEGEWSGIEGEPCIYVNMYTELKGTHETGPRNFGVAWAREVVASGIQSVASVLELALHNAGSLWQLSSSSTCLAETLPLNWS